MLIRFRVWYEAVTKHVDCAPESVSVELICCLLVLTVEVELPYIWSSTVAPFVCVCACLSVCLSVCLTQHNVCVCLWMKVLKFLSYT